MIFAGERERERERKLNRFLRKQSIVSFEIFIYFESYIRATIEIVDCRQIARHLNWKKGEGCLLESHQDYQSQCRCIERRRRRRRKGNNSFKRDYT